MITTDYSGGDCDDRDGYEAWVELTAVDRETWVVAGSFASVWDDGWHSFDLQGSFDLAVDYYED